MNGRSDRDVIVDALAYMASQCRAEGLRDECDEYLLTLERVRYGDLELVPTHRSTGVR
jgi:hypothetical protein